LTSEITRTAAVAPDDRPVIGADVTVPGTVEMFFHADPNSRCTMNPSIDPADDQFSCTDPFGLALAPRSVGVGMLLDPFPVPTVTKSEGSELPDELIAVTR
jgi:hypothetical protein